ncbi:hypothetical protein FOC36_02750 [Enterococcus gallinarum]|nr:hypothetical protein FOC36_02750 [Enterococcus gallinarum]
MELNLISWNDREPKYDIRDWAPEHEKMGKGVTLSVEELKKLREILGMATVFLTNFIRCRTSFRMLFRLSLTMSLLGCDDLRQELTVKVRLPR